MHAHVYEHHPQFVHKHHHRQHAPSRGNVDAVNTHPFEYLVGEYLHLGVVMAIPCHVVAVIAFVFAGGVLASLNHTRFDIGILGLYEVHHHDTHHRLPQTNYGQCELELRKYIYIYSRA
jgi:sterol desaturase/sphingolipid hydroxylase (fatty acid hydroxylase superfamily)